MRRPVHEPVLEPRAVRALTRLQVAKSAKSSRLVARIEQCGRDSTKVPRPNQVIDLIAVVIRLAPWGGRRGDERACVRLVLEAAQHCQRCLGEHPLISTDLA